MRGVGKFLLIVLGIVLTLSAADLFLLMLWLMQNIKRGL